MENRLAQALKQGEFVVTCEMIPGRGAHTEIQENFLEESARLYASGRVHAISVTDNPGGNPALLADTFGEDLLALGITPLVHFSCKDRSRNQAMSQLYTLERRGVENILSMTGDYPVSGWAGRSRPTFDLDPISLLEMINAMNAGLETPGRGGTTVVEEPCHFFAGAVVSPFKWTEGETLPQYFKLEKKVFAGAKYIISQLGYDARKMDELIRYMRERKLNVPVFANIFILNAGMGRSVNKGAFPGCVVTDEFLEVLNTEAQAEDKGKAARLLRAAKMVAVAKGLGYAGVHLGGLGVSLETVSYILDTADELAGQWQDCAKDLLFGVHDGFYYYQEDPQTGLNTDEHSSRVESRTEKAIMGNYRLSRFAHYWAFTPDKRLNKIIGGHAKHSEDKKGPYARHKIEHCGKALMYGCQNCGDCGLHLVAYSCPMSQCPKNQRSGPCGGSHDGWCEVFPGEKHCIWYKAYHRLKKYGEQETLGRYIAPPINWDNYHKSPWANFAFHRDCWWHVTDIETGETGEKKH